VPYQDIQARSTFGEVEREESQENITAAGLIKLSTDLNQFLRIPFRHFFSIKLVSKTFPDTVKVIHDEPQGVNSINEEPVMSSGSLARGPEWSCLTGNKHELYLTCN
jgi:hypothetical protein